MSNFGIETGGGLAGGLAKGLQVGTELGTGIEHQANEENVQQQELGIRQQQLGLQKQETGFAQQANQRANTAQDMELNKAAIDAYGSQISSFNRMAEVANEAGDVNKERALRSQISDMKAQMAQRVGRITTGSVANGYQQTMADAAALKAGKVTPEQLGPERTSNVTSAALGFPAQEANDAGDHNGDGQPDGTSPASQDADDIHLHAEGGNWSNLLQPAHRFVGAHLSALHPDHDDHVPGLWAGDHGMQPDDPNIAHAPVAQTADILSRKIPLVAHINSLPPLQDMLNQAHDQGATVKQAAAFSLAKKYGGMQNVVKAANTPDALEKSYRQNLQTTTANGVTDPEEAHKDAMQKTIYQSLLEHKIKAAAYFQNNGEAIPEDLKLNPTEEKIASYVAAGFPLDQSTLMANAPEIVAAREKITSERPLKDSEISKNNALAGAANRRGGTKFVSGTGSDGQTYNFNPADGSYVNPETGEEKPGNVQFTKNTGTSGRGSKQQIVYQDYTPDPKRPYHVIKHVAGTLVKDENGDQVWQPLKQVAGGGTAAPAGATAAPSAVDPRFLSPTGVPWNEMK